MISGKLLESAQVAEGFITLSFQSMIVIFVGWLVFRLIKHRSAVLRSSVLLATLLLLLILPLFYMAFHCFDVSSIELSLPISITGQTNTGGEGFTKMNEDLGTNPFRIKADPLKENKSKTDVSFFQKYLMLLTPAKIINGLGLIWIIGFLIQMLRLFYGTVFMKGFRSGLKEMDDEQIDEVLIMLKKKFPKMPVPKVFISAVLNSPVALGIFKPIIILPEDLHKNLDAKEIRSIFLHEMSHIFHKDLVIDLVKEIVSAVYWWNPFVYSLNRDLSRSREEISDNHAIIGSSSKEYAEFLINLAAKTNLISPLPVSAGLASPHVPLKERIRQILSKERNMDTKLKRSTAMFLTVATVVLACFTLGHTWTFTTKAGSEAENTLHHSLNTVAESDNRGDSVSHTDETGEAMPGYFITPSEGETVKGIVYVDFFAEAQTGVARIYFWLDGEPILGTVQAQKPYAFDWNTATVENGPHVLSAGILDKESNTYVDSITVMVDNLPGEISGRFTTLSDGATVKGVVHLDVYAEALNGVANVQIMIEGNPGSCGSQQLAPYDCSWNTTVVENGPHTLRAIIVDGAENTFTTPSITVTVDNSSEEVSGHFITPSEDDTLKGIVFSEIHAEAPAGVALVQMKIDGKFYANANLLERLKPYTFNWPTTILQDGPHILSGTIVDEENNIFTVSPITVTVDNSSEEVSGHFITLADGDTVKDWAYVRVFAEAPNGVAAVQIKIDGRSDLCGLQGDTPYDCFWDTTRMDNGHHTLSATIIDRTNNIFIISPITVMVVNSN